MSTPSHESPRFLCRVVRCWASLADWSAPAAGVRFGSGHLANCPACREHFRAATFMESRLRREAAAEMHAVPPDLERKIAAAVRQAQHPQPVRIGSRVVGWTAALGTVAAVVAIAWIVGHRSPSTPRDAENRAAEVGYIVAAVGALPAQFRDTVVPSATRLAGENPLWQEVVSVESDARSALSFLAANFLPSQGLSRLLPIREDAALRGS